jgi:hypothetical protein
LLRNNHDFRNNYFNYCGVDVDWRHTELAAQPLLGLWPQRGLGADINYSINPGSHGPDIKKQRRGVTTTALFYCVAIHLTQAYALEPNMFRQSLFNRYPRSILVITIIVLMAVISIGLLALDKGYSL